MADFLEEDFCNEWMEKIRREREMYKHKIRVAELFMGLRPDSKHCVILSEGRHVFRDMKLSFDEVINRCYVAAGVITGDENIKNTDALNTSLQALSVNHVSLCCVFDMDETDEAVSGAMHS